MKQKFALLCIDLQKEYFKKERPLFTPEGSKVLKNVILLLEKARGKKIPVIHIRHISKNPSDSTFNADSPFIEFMPEVAPQNEYIVTKSFQRNYLRVNIILML